MDLYNCLFEIRLCSAKERGNGRLGRVDTGLLARTLPSGTKEHANTHGRDALCPSAKIQKHAAFGIIHRQTVIPPEYSRQFRWGCDGVELVLGESSERALPKNEF